MKPSLDVVFATYSGLPEGDPDDLLALSILQSRGLQAGVIDWRTANPNSLDSRLVVLRSTWDYHHHYREFLDWVDVVASRTRLRNSAELIRWNADKKYLLELKRLGVEIVPTLCIKQEEAGSLDWQNLAAKLADSELHSANQVVVKPALGLATFGVKKFALGGNGLAEATAHMASLAGTADILIQPYLDAVEADGEHALIYIEGNYSHAVSKTAFQQMAAAGHAGERAVTAGGDEVQFGLDVLDRLKQINGSRPLYARVDVVRDQRGKLVLMELELIEPSLFLACEAGAGARFADAIAAALN